MVNMVGASIYLILKEKTRNRWCRRFDHRRRQHQCTHTETNTTPIPNFANMASSSGCKISPIIPIFVFFLLVVSSSICPVYSSETETGNLHAKNQTFRPVEELTKLKIIRERLNKINKPAVKTIQANY